MKKELLLAGLLAVGLLSAGCMGGEEGEESEGPAVAGQKEEDGED